MNKVLFGTIFTAVFILSTVSSSVFKTAVVESEKNVKWIVQNINKLKSEKQDLSFAPSIESAPFNPFEDNPEEWVIGLKLEKGEAGNIGNIWIAPEMKIAFRSLNSKETGSLSINGTLAFKNSTNQVLYETAFENLPLMRGKYLDAASVSFEPGNTLSEYWRSNGILSVNFGGLFYNSPKLTLSDIAEKLNNVLILEFSLMIVSPLSFTVQQSCC